MKKRVGLIGSGWYGKSDLFRLIQVAPVEVVSLCDVDKKMLAEAADMVAARQARRRSRALSATTARCSKEKDLDIVLIATPDHWHALPMIAAVKAGATSTCRSRSASTSSKARRCSPPPASTSASCRSARSAAARRT